MQDSDFIGLKPEDAARHMRGLSDKKERGRVRKAYLWANQVDLEGVGGSGKAVPWEGDVWQPSGAVPGSGTIGLVLILAGIALAVWSFFFDVSAGVTYGREIANLERIAMRTMLLISGVGGVVAGSVLYAGGKIYDEMTRPRE